MKPGQLSEQAQLVEALYAKGYSNKDLAALTGRSPRYITQARDSRVTVGRGGKVATGKGQNLIPALKALNEQGRMSPAEQPERRQNKAGQPAKVRAGVKPVPGTENIRVDTKRGNATLKSGLGAIAGKGKYVKWNVKVKWIKVSDRKIPNTGISGHLPKGWTSDDLLNRVNNPQQGDNWKAGDMVGALKAIAISQNQGKIQAAGAVTEVHMVSMD